MNRDIRRRGAGPAAALAALLAVAWPCRAHAQGIDWSRVEGGQVDLFYTGQASFEWMLTEDDHSGGPKIRKGKTCVECHADEEREIGELIASGEKLEPDPIPGKRPVIPVTLKTAHDGERLYVRLEWPRAEGSVSGAMDPAQTDPDFETKAALLFSDGSLRAAALTGCWATCHDDLVSMPSDLPDEDLTKYLARSRSEMTRSGGGTNLKSRSELQDLLAQGVFMEYWQARANPGEPAKPASGIVLEERREAEGGSPVRADAEIEGESWVVVLSRPLSVSGSQRLALEPGRTYTFGIAIHDQHADKRFHHVSLERTLRLDGGEADFVAERP